MKKPHKAHCSFCRKSYRVVGPLVEGPGNVYICTECIELCQSIIVQEKRRRQRLAGTSASFPAPELLRERLHQVVGALVLDMKSLADAVSSHYANQANSQQRGNEKNLLLLIGPSRSAAIFLARAIAHVVDVPFARGDAEDLCRIRDVADSEDSMFLRLLEAADFDIDAAQRGIVFLDGMDRRDAQEELVDLLEGGSSRVKLFPQELRIDIVSMLFVCFGAFLELDELIARRGRHPEQPILDDDLLTLGVLPSFVRRLRAIVRVSPLEEHAMTHLVVSADLKRWPNDSNI